jgi:hypothetical protein
MKKLWDWLFPKRIDPKWYVVDAYRGEWVVHSTWGRDTHTCNYQIEYSPVFNEYRLVSSGYDAKSHRMYTNTVVPAFNKLIKNKNNDIG